MAAPPSMILFLLGVVVVQIPVGILVYYDAKRLGVEQPERYFIGIVGTHLLGVAVALYYLSNRDSLSAVSEEHSTDDTS